MMLSRISALSLNGILLCEEHLPPGIIHPESLKLYAHLVTMFQFFNPSNVCEMELTFLR